MSRHSRDLVTLAIKGSPGGPWMKPFRIKHNACGGRVLDLLLALNPAETFSNPMGKVAMFRNHYVLMAVVLVLCGGVTLVGRPSARGIHRCDEYPRYWQYDGEPVLLFGGSSDDNLFQVPGLKKQLNLLAEVGGNYIRCTMSSRQDRGFEVRAFKRLPNGKYDLDRWNPEYWKRFERMLRLTEERDIVPQVELWAQWDLNGERWDRSPWNPVNNINYSTSDTTLQKEYGRLIRTNQKQDFFLTVPKLQNDGRLLDYQQKFADKILEYSLAHDHVLYCVTNEIFAQYPPEWGYYWARYVRRKAEERGKEIYSTEVYQEEDITHKLHRASLDHPEIYDYVDMSQNSTQEDQRHWDRLMWVWNYLSKRPRPINHVKTYGGEIGWTDGAAHGIERWWRSLIGGAASCRFHRPPAGIGLDERARHHVKSMRMLVSRLDIFDCVPDTKSSLLSSRSPDEAYLTYERGRQYAVYFPDGGAVKLDLSGAKGRFELRWLDIEGSRWEPRREVKGGGKVRLDAPGAGNWAALILKE